MRKFSIATVCGSDAFRLPSRIFLVSGFNPQGHYMHKMCLIHCGPARPVGGFLL